MKEKIKAWLIINAGVPDFVALKTMTISDEIKINTFVYNFHIFQKKTKHKSSMYKHK